jgi:hypothetical protein
MSVSAATEPADTTDMHGQRPHDHPDLQVMPVMVQIARSCRPFLSVVMHHLAADLGVRQFLDIGTGPADGGQHL